MNLISVTAVEESFHEIRDIVASYQVSVHLAKTF